MSDLKPGLAVDLLARLVAIPSVNPNLQGGASGEAEIARYIVGALREWGWDAETTDVAPGRPNAMGVLRGSGGGRSLLFNGHIDTVSVEGLQAPFEPAVRGGKLFGRGSADMKGGVAAMLSAAECLARGPRPRGDVTMTFVADEEFLSLGTEAVVRAIETGTLPRPDAAINTEPTDAKICLAHKGFAWVDVETVGVAAHGSRPDLGVDAIAKMGKVLVGVERLQETLAAGPRHPLLGPGTVHASLIEGGREISTYPDRCRLQIERRTVPPESLESIDREFAGILDGIRAQDPAFVATHNVTFGRSPWSEDPSTEIAKLLRGVATRVMGGEPGTMTMTGWLDIALLADAGIPTVVFGAGGGGFHAHEEWADIETLDPVARVYVDLVREFCG